MNIQKFTIKAQEALQEAINTVRRGNGQAVTPLHLLYGLLSKGESVVDFLLGKSGTDAKRLQEVDRSELSR